MSFTPKTGNQNLLFLDGLRGIAAFYVMVGHARWLLWEGYSEGYRAHPSSYSFIDKALMYSFSLFKYGHEAVLFFFVLSGFVIHLRYARAIQAAGAEATFDWRPYVWRRARRLYPPLLAALAIAFLLQSIGAAQGYLIYHRATPYHLINESVSFHADELTLAGNLAFLMNTYTPVFGGDGPLWSLKFEWWFYMVYPVFWWWSRRSMVLATGIMTGLYAASYVPTAWPVALLRDVFGSMLAWWLGALLADRYAGRFGWGWHRIVFGFVCAGVVVLLFPGPPHDLGMAFMFCGSLAFLFRLRHGNFWRLCLQRLKPLGDMSYTLYVTHFPILLLGSGWLMSRSPGHLLPRHFGWVFAGVAVSLSVAFGLHVLVERPFLSRAARRIGRVDDGTRRARTGGGGLEITVVGNGAEASDGRN